MTVKLRLTQFNSLIALIGTQDLAGEPVFEIGQGATGTLSVSHLVPDARPEFMGYIDPDGAINQSRS